MTDPQQPLTRRSQGANSATRSTSRSRGPAEAPPEPPSPQQRTLLLVIAGALAFILLAIGALYAGIGVGTSSPTKTTSSSKPPKKDVRAVPADRPAAVPIRTCSISTAASDNRLVHLFGSVVNVGTDDQLYSADAATPQPLGGVQKTLTAAAALAVLGGSYRIPTTVVDGATPGQIALVGAGDATLSSLPDGANSIYGGAAHIADLAKNAVTAFTTAHPGQQITEVVLDSSYWDPNDNWDASWDRSLQTTGLLSEVTALQVDGDRQDPKSRISPRSTDPIAHVGQVFADDLAALGMPGVSVSTGVAETGAPQLAQVQSQPVSQLVKQMLLGDDDTLAEMLARIVSKKENLDGSGGSIQNAITTALAKDGLDASALTIEDGSGVSSQNAVSATFMTSLMKLVATKSGTLALLTPALSTAGTSGTLASRFTGSSAVAKGKVFAQAGTISGSFALAGYTTAKDGTTLAFSFAGIGSGVTESAQPVLDALAAGAFTCGNNLSTN